jgi:lariat debranching enzyme
VRNVDVYRLKCLSNSDSRLDIQLSHDWPLGIEQHGDTQGLLRRKPFFRAEVEQNNLGSPPLREILDMIKPRWWFAAHLHVKFKASVKHVAPEKPPPAFHNLSLAPSQVRHPKKSPQAEKESKVPEPADSARDPIPDETTANEVANPDKYDEEKSERVPETEFISLESSNRCDGPDLTDQMTEFLALDKCLPRRQYLSILQIPVDMPKAEARLEYDLEWLAILRKTHHLTCTQRRRVQVPSDLTVVSPYDMEWILERLKTRQPDTPLAIPENFCATVPGYSHPVFRGNPPPLPLMGNPQMDELLSLLELEHRLTVPYDENQLTIDSPVQVGEVDAGTDDNEIDIDDVIDAEPAEEVVDPGKNSSGGVMAEKEAQVSPVTHDDENEIDIDSVVDDSPASNPKVESEQSTDGTDEAVLKKARFE